MTAFAQAPLHWDSCEPSYSDGSGQPETLYYPGHADPEQVDALARRWYAEYGYENVSHLAERPQHVYLRKVPTRRDGWPGMLHVEQRQPGRGASPVTVFRFLSSWDRQPCQSERASVRCSGPGRIGIPRENIIDPPEGVEYVYLCRAHHADFDARWREAMRKALGQATA